MTAIFRQICRNQRGASATEFALAAPILVAMLFGVGELGVLFHAHSGLKSAVEDAAHYATLWPTPSEADILNRISDKRFGLISENIVGPTVAINTNAQPRYIDVTMGYNISLNYILGSKTITLTETRRAFVSD